MLVLKRIHVHYTLRAEPGADRAKIERAHEHHHRRCPVYRSISAAIGITTSYEVVDA